MSRQILTSKATRLAITAIFTSLVCAATMIFSIYVPHTRGFFNIGETMVYTTALLFGPFVGAFAGGVGSMLADIFLGYSHYAPATLVTKAFEGAIVGALARRRAMLGSKLRWRTFTLAVGLVTGTLLGGIGSFYYSGEMELYFGIPPPENPVSIVLVPPLFWYMLGLLTMALIALAGYLFEPEFGWLVLAVLAGGLEMVAGYFLYEQIFLGVAAIVEVPVNIGQMTIGLIVSIPLVRAVWRSIPSLKYRGKSP